MIIDVHAHIFSDNKGEAILSDLSSRTNIPYFSDGSVKSLNDSMEKAGIDISIASRITTRPQGVKSINSWLLENMRENIPVLATIHPDMPDLEEYMDSLTEMRFKGIKVHSQYQGIFVDDPKMYPIYDSAQSLKLPILFHAGLDRGLPPPTYAKPARLINVHRRFPNLTMIAAHMGGEDNYEETEALLLGEDIYLDTAFVLRIMEKSTLRRFFARHPIERFLFGTDTPFTDQKTELNYLLDLPFLTSGEKEKIAGLNAAALLELKFE
jgi:uncharacterized protein